MKTRIFEVDADHPDADVMKIAAACLLAGGLVAFPTETVYGLGANALDADAVNRIYIAKERPANNPLIVHIASPEQVKQVALDIPDITRQLAVVFWPGALTMVLKRRAHIPANISAGRETVAVRMPAHAVALSLIETAGVPVAAPSANLFTRPSATTAGHVLADLDGRVDIILDGGATRIGLESTVIDLTHTIPMVLRPGGVTLESLREVVPVMEMHTQAVLADEPAPLSPGMLLKHYSPNAKLLLFVGEFEAVTVRMQAVARGYIAAGKRVGILTVDEERAYFDGTDVQIVTLGSHSDFAGISHNLFAALRTLDEIGVDIILVRMFEQVGLGVAIADRLLRAAEGETIEVK